MGPVFLDVGYTFHEAAYKAEMSRRKIKDFSAFVTEGAAATLHHFSGTEEDAPSVILCMKIDYSWDLSTKVGLIAHEATHVMQACKKFMREVEAGSEFEAYTVHYVTQEIFKGYQKEQAAISPLDV